MRINTLPLSKTSKKIAVIGPLADSTRDIEGGWTVEGLFGGGGKSHPVTILAGLKNKLPAAEITYVSGPAPSRIFPGLFEMITGQEAAASAHRGRNQRLARQNQGRRRQCGHRHCGDGRVFRHEQ